MKQIGMLLLSITTVIGLIWIIGFASFIWGIVLILFGAVVFIAPNILNYPVFEALQKYKTYARGYALLLILIGTFLYLT